eukprot:TRINITY_DN218_c0_g1_i1.p1 TRINITY_DN218_c0_g1~~TRINITY_DN218_c0_g1_i1.p1  ORF type:complete len:359 (-),score=78.90 TRINITY_DN218_c0_g1_i1:77-1153(-)
MIPQQQPSSYPAAGMMPDRYNADHFPELNDCYANRYKYHHGGMSVADWPNRRSRMAWSYVFDWLWVVIGLALLGTWFAEPPTYYFRLDDVSISHPEVPETIGSLPIVLSIILGPIAVCALAQIWVRDLRDFHQSALTVLQIFVTNQVVCMFMWLLFGGLRPTFLSVCDPTPGAAPAYTIQGTNWYSDDICRADHHDLVKAKHSLPSDHAAGAASAALFCIIYLGAKLKVFDNKSHYWKLFLLLPFPILGLWFSFSRLHDGKHHFRDIIIGLIIGVIIAPIVYRLNFCSLLGPDNHIPCRYTWMGKYITWRGRDRSADRTLPVTQSDKVAEQQMHQMGYNPSNPLAIPMPMGPAGNAAV